MKISIKAIVLMTILMMSLSISSCTKNVATDNSAENINNYDYEKNIEYSGVITDMFDEKTPIKMTISFEKNKASGYYDLGGEQISFEGEIDEDNILESVAENGQTFIGMISGNDIYGVWGEVNEFDLYDHFTITRNDNFKKTEADERRYTLYTNEDNGFRLTISNDWKDYSKYYEDGNEVDIYYYTDKYTGIYGYEDENSVRKGFYLFTILPEDAPNVLDYDSYGPIGNAKGLNYIEAGSTGARRMTTYERYGKLCTVMQMGLDLRFEAIDKADSNSDYILPKSNSELLTENDINRLSSEDIRLAINEIYARRGLIFTSDEYKNYFNSKSWYKGTVTNDKFDPNIFNEFESKNLDFLIKYESTSNADKEYYKFLEDAYSNFPFSSTFVIGNNNKEHLGKYYELFNGEIPFYNKEKGDELYIPGEKSGAMLYIDERGFLNTVDSDYVDDAFSGSYIKYSPEHFTYYYFDMDLDGENELTLVDDIMSIYTFKYIEKDDKIVLWYYTYISREFLMGSRTIGYWNDGKYHVNNLDSDGNLESEISFLVNWISEDNTEYMINLPRYSDENKNIAVPDNIKNRGVLNTYGSYLDFEVSEDEWKYLTNEFFEEGRNTRERRKNVIFDYNELFSDFIN